MNLKNTQLSNWKPGTYLYVENEMKKYRVPFLYKIVFGSLYKYGGIFMPLLILLVAALGLTYSYTNFNFDLWPIIKGLGLGIILGLGGLVIISFIWHRLKVLKECKRIGITLNQWNQMVILTQISYL
jgi:hypothetical protein